MGIAAQATLASLHHNNNWWIPPARSEALVNVHALLTTIELNNNENFYEWKIDGKVCSKYNTCIVYGKLCDAGTHVPWYHSV